ncbi:hypothetical protein NBG4_890004 [Candidatus Sulfobium mesophilum]|uniref:Uncharacterized protein n=1 Tax=Candidatus Sulfobium mesophilum TaxID=2016548 RepID=A0A2U3QKW2_9BACT|nr:hypothetical protein NBG4_890004 [Candidatus Sulfobium mesophilum]
MRKKYGEGKKRSSRSIPLEISTAAGPVRLKISSAEDLVRLKWAIISDPDFLTKFLHGTVLPLTDKDTGPRKDLKQNQFMLRMKIQAGLLGYIAKLRKGKEQFARYDITKIARIIKQTYGTLEGFRPFTTEDTQNFKRRWIMEGQEILVANTIQSRALLVGLLDIQKDLLWEHRDDSKLLALYNLTAAAIEHFMPDYFTLGHFQYLDGNLFQPYHNAFLKLKKSSK